MSFTDADKHSKTTWERRNDAGSNLMAAWGFAILPNIVGEFTDLPDSWWFYAIRFGLSAAFVVCFVVWVYWVVRDLRERRAAAKAG